LSLPRLKYCLTCIMILSINFTSYCRAPSRISCIMSGSNPPSQTWKYLAYKEMNQISKYVHVVLPSYVMYRSSLRYEFLLIPYCFEASARRSSCTQCCLCVLGSLRIKYSSLNCLWKASFFPSILLVLIYSPSICLP